jgi:hypothetical protein
MSTVSPESIAKLQSKLEAAQKALEARQQFFRDNPSALAAETARRIRADQLKGKSAAERPADFNGGMHWYQKAWGELRKSALRPLALESGVILLTAQCPTTACVAGTVDTLAGYPMVVFPEDLPTSDGDFVSCEYVLRPDGMRRQVRDVARDLLLLDFDQANYLFSAERTEDQVLEVLDVIATGVYNWTIGWDDDREYVVKVPNVADDVSDDVTNEDVWEDAEA